MFSISNLNRVLLVLCLMGIFWQQAATAQQPAKKTNQNDKAQLSQPTTLLEQGKVIERIEKRGNSQLYHQS